MSDKAATLFVAILVTFLSVNTSFSQGIEYENTTEKDHELYDRLTKSDSDIYKVDLLTGGCKKLDSEGRRQYKKSANLFRTPLKVKKLDCGIDEVTRLSKRVVANGRLIGWIRSTARPFCKAPTINELGFVLGNCNVTGCLLRVPENVDTAFLTPSKKVAQIINSSVKPNAAIARLSAKRNTVQDKVTDCQ